MNKTVILVDNRNSYGVSKTYKKDDKFQAISETTNGYTIKTSEGNFTFGKHRFIDNTPEAILAYCQEQYPIGTKINCVLGWTNQRNPNETGILRNKVSIDGNNRVWSQGSYYNICIYDSNKGFAEIISKPEIIIPKVEEPIVKYYKCLRWAGFNHTPNKIYKTITDVTIECNNPHSSPTYINGIFKNQFILSTKEEYDAQFDTFVLPEAWCIKDLPEVKQFFESYHKGNYSCKNNAYLHYPKIEECKAVGGYKCYYTIIQKGYTEITYEQFLKYVLKDNTTKPTATETIIDKQISLKSIKEALLKEYDKTDVEDIMKVIDKIK